MADKSVRMSPAKFRDYLAAAAEAGLETHKARVLKDGTLEIDFTRDERAEAPLDEWLANRETR